MLSRLSQEMCSRVRCQTVVVMSGLRHILYVVYPMKQPTDAVSLLPNLWNKWCCYRIAKQSQATSCSLLSKSMFTQWFVVQILWLISSVFEQHWSGTFDSVSTSILPPLASLHDDFHIRQPIFGLCSKRPYFNLAIIPEVLLSCRWRSFELLSERKTVSGVSSAPKAPCRSLLTL